MQNLRLFGIVNKGRTVGDAGPYIDKHHVCSFFCATLQKLTCVILFAVKSVCDG